MTPIVLPVATGLALALAATSATTQETVDPVRLPVQPARALRVSVRELGPGPIYAATEELLAFADEDGRLAVYDPDTGTLASPGVEILWPTAGTFPFDALGGTFVFDADESANGADLDGDGDADGFVVMAYRSGLGLSVAGLDLSGGVEVGLLTERDALVAASERALGIGDVNGSGTDMDVVLLHWDLETGALAYLEFVAERVVVEAGRAAFFVPEELVGDRNDDGDALDLVLHTFDPSDGRVNNTRLAIAEPRAEESGVHLGERWEAFRVSEAGQEQDLNGDGDTLDQVLHVYDRDTNTLTSLGWASAWNFFDDDSFGTYFPGFALGGDYLAFLVLESEQGQADLNGDGDALDRVLFTVDLPGLTTRNWSVNAQRLELAADRLALTLPEGTHRYARPAFLELPDGPLGITDVLGSKGTPLLSGPRTFLFQGQESLTAADWNGDGDTNDFVPLLVDPETGYATAAPHGIRSGTIRPLVDRVAFGVSEGADGVDWNGDGDLQDTLLGLHDPWRGSLVRSDVPLTLVPFAPYLEPVGRRSLAVWFLEGSFPDFSARLSVVRIGP